MRNSHHTFPGSRNCLRNLVLFICLAVIATDSFAGEPAELVAARKEYEQSAPAGNEAARLRLVDRLAKTVEGFIAEYRATGSRQHSDDLTALYAELRKHPAPKDSDARALSQSLAGKWQSPRHDYLFRKDGTWTMLPAEKDATRGTWRIEGNQYIDSASLQPGTPSRYTIILLNDRYFVFMDKDAVFFESRVKK